MVIALTGNHLVDGIAAIPITGNVTPVSWYQHIRYTNKRGTYTDHLAIAILSDIFYWYRPSEARDEATGQAIAWKKKFKAEFFQRSYEVYAALMGASYKQIQTSFRLLENLQLIKLHFKTVPTNSGRIANNVMFVEPNPTAIAAITYSIGSDVLKRKVKKSRKKKKLHAPTAHLEGSTPYLPNGRQPTDEIGCTNTETSNGNYFLNITYKHKQASTPLTRIEQCDRVIEFSNSLGHEEHPSLNQDAIAIPVKTQSPQLEKAREVTIEKPLKSAIVFQLNDAGWLRMPRATQHALARWITIRRIEYQLATLFSNVSVATDAKGNTKTEGNQIVFSCEGKESLENEFFEDSPLLSLRDELNEKDMMSQDVFNNLLRSLFLQSVEWLESQLGKAKPMLAEKSPAFLFYNADQTLLNKLIKRG